MCLKWGNFSRKLWKTLKINERSGLAKEQVQLGIMDRLSGLENVFREEFPNAKIQHYQVHVSRNGLSPEEYNPTKTIKIIYYSNGFYYSTARFAPEIFLSLIHRYHIH
jgi:transposase-like protein